jgi:hypothetical protein
MNLFYAKPEPTQVTLPVPVEVTTTESETETEHQEREKEQEKYIKQMEEKLESLEHRLEDSWAFVFERTIKTVTNNVIVSVNKFYNKVEKAFLY